MGLFPPGGDRKLSAQIEGARPELPSAGAEISSFINIL
jgi:hypothetical protein